MLFDGANGAQGADLSTIFPTNRGGGCTEFAYWRARHRAAGYARGGQRWRNPNAVRLVNIFGLNIERRADDAWRLPSNLVDGAVDAQTLCKIEPLVVNGQAVTALLRSIW